MVSAPRSRRQFEAHPRSTSEPSGRLTGHLEANPLVEPQRVRIRDHIDIARARSSCACRDVVDEQSADSQSHRIRLHKQIIELAPAVPDRQHHREAKTPPCSVDGNSHASIRDCLTRRLDRIRIRRKLRAVLLPYIRGATLERLQSGRLIRPGIPNQRHHSHTYRSYQGQELLLLRPSKNVS